MEMQSYSYEAVRQRFIEGSFAEAFTPLAADSITVRFLPYTTLLYWVLKVHYDEEGTAEVIHLQSNFDTETQLSFFQRDNSSQKVLRLNGIRMLKCHVNNFTNTSNIQTGAHWLPPYAPWSTYTKVVQTRRRLLLHNITSNKAIDLCPFVNSWHIFANIPIFYN